MQEKINKINSNVLAANKLFNEQDLKEAAAHYKIALKEAQEIPTTDPEFLKRLQVQIEACNVTNAPAVISKEKQKWLKKHFGGGTGIADIGKQAVAGLIKKFIPRIKGAIEKNRPKAIAFMRGELDFKFQPLPAGQKPERRIVIIELLVSPDGDVSKDDIVIQIKKADLVQVHTAKYPDDYEVVELRGQDASRIETFSGMGFIEEILATNLEAAIDEVDFGDMK